MTQEQLFDTPPALPHNYIKVLDHGYVGLISTMGQDIDVVNAARVSYDKQTSKMRPQDEKLLSFLWQEGHTSPFRHAALTFEVYAPLLVARQHWKHTVASTFVDDQNGWNESSRRYITEEPTFYIPDEWRTAPENSKQGSGEPLTPELSELYSQTLNIHIENSIMLYEKALEEGICAEQARLFLPAYSLYVRYRWTTSLHSVLHYLALRTAHNAQQEIQAYADAIGTLTRRAYPLSYNVAIN